MVADATIVENEKEDSDQDEEDEPAPTVTLTAGIIHLRELRKVLLFGTC
jgi:hypothetical protein